MVLHILIPGFSERVKVMIIQRTVEDTINEMRPKNPPGHWRIIYEGAANMTLKIDIPDLPTTAASLLVLENVRKALAIVYDNGPMPNWTYSYEDEPIEAPVKESTTFSRYLEGQPSQAGESPTLTKAPY